MEKPVPLSAMMEEFSPEDRAEIEKRARQLIAEHQSLMQIRKAFKLTQADVAKALKTSQAHVAQVERKSDAMVSTIARFVKAMGGELNLVVSIPDRGQVVLKLGEHVDAPVLQRKPKRKEPAKTAAPQPSSPVRSRRASSA